MERLPVTDREIMIRYGKLTPHARDAVMDQFYLMIPSGNAHGSYMSSYILGIISSCIAIVMFMFAVMMIIAKLSNDNQAGAYWFMNTAFLLEFTMIFYTLKLRMRHRYKQKLYQTTELGLSLDRLNVHSRQIHGGTIKQSMRWQDISGVKLVEQAGKEPATIIELVDIHRKQIKLRLDYIQTIEERRLLRHFLLKRAPQVDASEAAQALLRMGHSNDVPFTKLWSKALQDSRPRVHTEPLVPGTSLQEGRFQIAECIGSGGQGAVYLSERRQVTGDDQVVLKEYVLPDHTHAAEHKAAVETFEREIQLLGKMNHGGVIKMMDAFVEDHRAYLVLEHINGTSLRDIVQQQGPLAPANVVALAQQMCDVLQYLHAMKPAVMHLDFSPENLLITPEGHITLIDFNISAEENSLRTRTVMGKQRYMAPEQYRGKPSTRSDIYSLGATLFFLLTGKEPEPISVCRPSAAAPNVSPSLAAVVERCTEMEEENRYETAVELKEALAALTEESEGTVEYAIAIKRTTTTTV